MSRLSLAQALPPEPLPRIFGWLVEIRSRDIPKVRVVVYDSLIKWPVTAEIFELRDLCLVCRSWRPAAQAILFRSLRVWRVYPVLLTETFRARPHLARAVQAIELAVPQVDEQSGWVDHQNWEAALKPFTACPSIRHVSLAWIPLASRTLFMDFLTPLDLVSLVSDARGWSNRGVTGKSVLSMDDLVQVSQKPTLRLLESRCTPYPLVFEPPFVRSAAATSFLTTLHLNIFHNDGVGVAPLLTLAASTLARLDISSESPLTHSNFGHALQHLTALREMRIYCNPSVEEAGYDWFVQTIPRVASLKKLAVNCEMVPHLAIMRAPQRLELLEYSWQGADLVQFLRELTDVFDKAPPSYATFRLVPYVEYETDEQEMRAGEALDVFKHVLAGMNVNLDHCCDFGPRDFPRCESISFF